MKGVVYTIIALMVGMVFLLVLTLRPSSFILSDYFEVKNQVDSFQWNVKEIVEQFLHISYNGTGYRITAGPRINISNDIEMVAQAQNITYYDNNFSETIELWNDNLTLRYSGWMPNITYSKPKRIYLMVTAENITTATENLATGDVPAHIVVSNGQTTILEVSQNISYTSISQVNTNIGTIYLGPYIFVDFNSTLDVFLGIKGPDSFLTKAKFEYRNGVFNLTYRAI